MFFSVGDRLKQLVKEKNMEQQEASAKMGMKAPTFNGYMSNKRNPSIEKLKLFADFFQISVDYLIGYTEVRDPNLKHLSEEQKLFIHEPDNTFYIQLAMDIKDKTIKSNYKQVSNKSSI